MDKSKRFGSYAARSVDNGPTVALTATVSDTGSGESSIASANYTRGAGAWPGTAMTAVDGALNEPSEDVTATGDTRGGTGGTYDLCAYGTDEVGNAGPGTPACAQLTVLDADVTPPSVTDLRAQPNPADPGDTVNLSALVTDNVGVDAVYVEIFDASGASVANLTAAYDTGTGRYVASREMRAGTGRRRRARSRSPLRRAGAPASRTTGGSSSSQLWLPSRSSRSSCGPGGSGRRPRWPRPHRRSARPRRRRSARRPPPPRPRPPRPP